MKSLIHCIVCVLVSGILLAGCQADSVAPSQEGGMPRVAADFGNPNLLLDTICQSSDTLFMIREDDGSSVINRCFTSGGVQINCPSNPSKWGYAIVSEGYDDNEGLLSVSFAMAFGWYCNNVIYRVADLDGFSIDRNGFPGVGPGWTSVMSAPGQNRFQIRMRLNSLPQSSFLLAFHVGAVRLNLFGVPIPGSSTSLWCRNRNYQSSGALEESASEWLLPFSPQHCLGTVSRGGGMQSATAATVSN